MNTRKANHTASGIDMNGQMVLWDASTGDTLKIGTTLYHVRDTYPFGVRLERPTPFGVDSTRHSYESLKQAGAFYAAH